MKLALLATRPKGIGGGAETLCDGLADALRAAGHLVDSIHAELDESCFDGIRAGYSWAHDLDLSRYDAVISTKPPTYAVRHPRHIVYLIHTIRVFYDMFDSWTDGRSLRWFRRDRIRELDYEALAAVPDGRRFAIGEEVARRLWRSLGLATKVVHPALADAGEFRQGPFEHFLHVGRLHPWKRTDLVVKAYRRARADVPLLIAGTGPEEERLRDLAGGDPRIRFLGHVGRKQLIELYSRSLAVPFVPIREDFGYITLEAMLSGKPVITASDSGEVVRLVNETGAGLVVEPDPDALGRAIDRLAAATDEAQDLGAKGIERARQFNWPDVVGTLLGSLDEPRRESAPRGKRKTRLLVVDTQPIEPPVGGGRLRLWGLYSHLPDDIEARYVGTYDWPGSAYRALWHNEKLLEVTVPQSEAHFKAHEALKAKDPRLTVDVTFPRLGRLSAALGRRMCDEAAWADVICVSHPWAYTLLAGCSQITGKRLLYDAHNVEGLLRRDMIGSAGLAGEIAAEVERLEARLCEQADFVLACSEEDIRLFRYLYDVPAEKLRLVPNGVDTAQIRPADHNTRAAARIRFSLTEGEKVALFIGSDYAPNREAARFIGGTLAGALTDVRFLLVGGCSAAFPKEARPANVILTGPVDDATRNAAYLAADVALNPMTTGSGTNIKMLDYLAAGLPALSTSVGARGLDSGDPGSFVVADLPDFPGRLRAILSEPSQRREMAATARRIAEERYDWRRISSEMAQLVRDPLRRSSGIPPTVTATVGPAQANLRLVILTTWETRCGIADYSRFLATELPPSVEWRIYAEAGSCGVPEDDRVSRNWTYGLPDTGPLRQSLLRDQPDVLLVQHNPGFFREAGLEQLIALGEATSVPVAITLHAAPGLRMTPGFAERLRKADRLYVLRPSDIRWLADRGVNGPARIISHGVVRIPDRSREEARALLGLSESFLIGTFGYARPHKGILELIQAFELLAPSLPALRLLLLCAEYPGPDSAVYRSMCERKIATSPHRSRIDACFEHLPLEQVGLLLQACDLVVLPYWPSRESSSAAARVAVAARRPILVSSSPIFEDLEGCASVSFSCDPHPLADVIKRLVLDRDLRENVRSRVCAFADANAWPRVAARLAGDLNALERRSPPCEEAVRISPSPH